MKYSLFLNLAFSVTSAVSKIEVGVEETLLNVTTKQHLVGHLKVFVADVVQNRVHRGVEVAEPQNNEFDNDGNSVSDQSIHKVSQEERTPTHKETAYHEPQGERCFGLLPESLGGCAAVLAVGLLLVRNVSDCSGVSFGGHKDPPVTDDHDGGRNKESRYTVYQV